MCVSVCLCVCAYTYCRFARGITVACIGTIYTYNILKCENDTTVWVFGDGTREGVWRLSFVWYYL